MPSSGHCLGTWEMVISLVVVVCHHKSVLSFLDLTECFTLLHKIGKLFVYFAYCIGGK